LLLRSYYIQRRDCPLIQRLQPRTTRDFTWSVCPLTPTEHHTNSFPGNGIFAFAGHYLPRGISPSYPYISPGVQPNKYLKYLPPAVVSTCGFDPLRDVGGVDGTILQQAKNQVDWYHFDTLTHGFLQMAPVSLKFLF
jgi:acetyl esterase/lipase